MAAVRILGFTGELWFWRGPAPWHFVTVPEPECAHLAAMSSAVSYGWGVIPVTAQIGASLLPGLSLIGPKS